jgi:hypothetical protein
MSQSRRGRLSPQIKRALAIMLRDRIVYCSGHSWFGNSREPINFSTIYTMFDRNLAYVSSTGKKTINHRAFLTDIGKAVASNLKEGQPEPLPEESARFIAQVTA